MNTPARRIPVPEDRHDVEGLLEQAGDYCGPVARPDDGTTSVYFLLPIARDDGVDPGARSVFRVAQPPHTFRECPDGSLEVRASIACYGGDGAGGSVELWHGYLDEGNVWRQV